MDEILVHRRVIPGIKLVGAHLYTFVEKGTMRVKCLAKARTRQNVPGQGPAEPTPLDQETSALSMGPLLHHSLLY